MKIALSATTNSNGSVLAPNPTITVTPDKNLIIKCEGVSTTFGAPGEGCSFSSWEYQTTNAGAGESNTAVAFHSVTVGAVAPTSTENPPKSWDLYVSGNNVDGAPIVVTYSITTPTSTVVPSQAPMIEKDVNQAAYDADHDSPYAGTMILTRPTGKPLQISVWAHIRENTLYVYDRSRLISPNGVLALNKYDAWPTQFPVAAYKRWVHVASPPEYQWDIDARARLISFRQQEGITNGAIEAAGEFALPPVGDTGDTPLLQGQTLEDRDLNFSLRLTPKGLATCGSDTVPPSMQCAENQECMGGFCSEPNQGGPSDEELANLTDGSPFIKVASKQDAWIDAGLLAVTSIPPSAVWCAQNPTIGFSVSWPSSLYRFRSTPLLDFDLPCVGAISASGSSDISWGGPFPVSHRQALEKAGVFTERLGNADLMARCIRELDRVAPPRGEEYSDKFSDFSGILDYKADCVSIGPVAQLITETMYRTIEEYDQFSAGQLVGLISRAGQEWFRLHGFLMNQGVQQSLEDDVFLRQSTSTSSGGAPGSQAPSPRQLISIMERGLAFGFKNIVNKVLLQHQEAFPLWRQDYRANTGTQHCALGNTVMSGCPSNWRCETLQDAQYANGDPRYMDCKVAVPDGESCPEDQLWRHCVVDEDNVNPLDDIPNTFLPPLLDSLTGYLRVVQADLEQAAIARYSELKAGSTSAAEAALRRYGNAMRLTTFFQAIGERVVATETACANGTCSYPRWFNRYGNAARELDLQMEHTAGAAEKLATGENPLGVSDDDLPVFFGDVQGTNSRYFASSDYLMSTWAGPAVSSARTALASARDSWIASRNASLTTQQNEVAHQQRLDDIATGAGRTILENCGGLTVGGASLDSRSVVETLSALGLREAHATLDSCFIGGGKECTLAPDLFTVNKARLAGFTNNVGAVQSELCRLDYMRVKAPEAWQRAMDNLKTNRMLGWAKTSQNELEGFMAHGMVPYCDWCATNGGCQSPCIESCYSICGPTPGKWKCWTDNEKEGKCAYRRSECQHIIDAAAGGPGSTHYYYKYKTADGRAGLIAYCADEGGPYDEPNYDREVVLRDCIKQLTTDEPEYTVRLAEAAEKCLDEGSGKTGAPQRKDSFSTRWQSVKFDDVAGVAGVVVAPGVEVPIPVGPDHVEILSVVPTARMNVLSFYDQPLVWLRADPAWGEAVTFCGAQGYGTRLPEWEIPKACMRGRLGVARSQTYDIWSQAEREKAVLYEKVGNWYSWVLSCREQGYLNAIAQNELGSYLDRKAAMLDAAGKLETMRAFVSGGVSGFSGGGGLGAIESGGAGAGTAGAAAVGGALVSGIFASEADRIRSQITQLDNAHQKFQAAIAAQKEAMQCATNIKLAYNAIGPVREQIAQRFDEFQTALENLANLQSENTLAFDTAALQLNTEKQRKVADFSHHYWYDEKVDYFRKQMKWAKQLTYLALRAVEFEFQESLDLRGKVIAAKHPDELGDALLAIQQAQATRGVNRKRPEQSSIVLSLRDDILEIENRTSAPSGERNWTAAQRFKGRMWDERYSIRDENGEWVGQGVAFSIKEKGVLENRCGERLWRVTATVQGDNLSPLEPGTPLVLLKKNTFYSQYCRGRGDGEKHQVNSIRPSNQLFTGKVSGSPEEAAAYSAAAMYPWFNVRRMDFYNEGYTKGMSEELAGRGLYGEYILLFPKQILDRASKNPFPLENVEDVLLRVDYLSVDNLPPVGTTDKAVPSSQ